jgi:hypothetical protein
MTGYYREKLKKMSEGYRKKLTVKLTTKESGIILEAEKRPKQYRKRTRR